MVRKRVKKATKERNSTLDGRNGVAQIRDVRHTTLLEYSSSSTVHGMRYLFDEDRHWSERLWWGVALSVSLLTCSYFIYKVYRKWDETPVIVTFSEESTPIWEIPFPAVTICSETKADRSVANYTDIYLKLRTSDFQPPWNVTEEELSYFQALSEVCIDMRNGTEKLNGSANFTSNVIHRLIEMSPTTGQLLLECQFRSTYHSCYDVFEKIITEEGVCYTFNSLTASDLFRDNAMGYRSKANGHYVKNWHPDTGYTDVNPDVHDQLYPARVLGSGSEHGLKISLMQMYADVDYMCRFPVQGFRMLLHEPGEFPQMSEYFMRVPLNQEMLVVVKPNMITTSSGLRGYSPERRQCYYNSDRQLKFFKVYTQRNCHLECLASLTLNLCKCVRLGYPRRNDTKICSQSDHECYKKTKQMLARFMVKNVRNALINESMCNCLPACTSITYDAESSQADVNWLKTFQSFEVDPQFYENLLQSEVTIYFKDILFTTARRSELYGYSDVVANCGGLLGLFLGMSLLSIVEICYFCSVRAICNWRSRAVSPSPVVGLESVGVIPTVTNSQL